MLLKFLILILIVCEQINFGWGVQGTTKAINKLERNSSSTSFLLSNPQEKSEIMKVEKKEKIPLLPLSPYPFKKSNTELNLNSVSACALDFETGALLWNKEKDKRLPMASLAKIMTALIILKDKNLEKEVEITEEATKIIPEESQMGLSPGDKIKVRDLLYGLVIYSANDAAKALAIYKSGNEKKFIDLMNKKAADLGLSHTHFTTVSGMDAPNNYSSAYDLALLFKVACQNPIFLQMLNTKTYNFTSEKGVDYSLENTDELLGKDPRIIGGKTGSTDQAGRCLVSLANDNAHKVITVVMNCPDRFGETQRLLDWVYSSYAW